MNKSLLFKAFLLSAFISVKFAINSNAQSSTSMQVQGPEGKLNATLDLPKVKEGEKCNLVVLMHGFMSSSQDPVMQTLSQKLLAKGYATLRFDFDGHGKSEGAFVDMTVMKEVADAKAIVEYIEGLGQFSSIGLAGHSQGGVVASIVAGELGRETISKVVLLAPAAVLVDDAKKGQCMMAHYDPQNVPERVDIFGHPLGRGYILEAQKLDIYGIAKQYTGPVCIIHGTGDEVVPYSYSQKYYDGYNDGELHLLDGENHMFMKDMSDALDIAADFLSK